MLDSLLKALDKLIELARIKQKREKARLDEFFTPAFNEVQAVHADYLAMFTDLAIRIDKIPDGADHEHPVAQETLEFLTQRRIVQRPVREKLRALSSIGFADHYSDHERFFLAALDSYLRQTTLTGNEMASVSTDILNQLKTVLGVDLTEEDLEVDVASRYLRNERIRLDRVAENCKDRCERLESAWLRLSEYHAKLKLHVISRST